MKIPSSFSCNSESAFLENAANNNRASRMDFSNSEVFLKICDEKGPNNIETAAASASAARASTSSGVYGDTVMPKANNLYANNLRKPSYSMCYTTCEYDC